VGAVVLGDGPEAAMLRDKVSASGLADRVLLGGYIKDARKYLPLFDALVIPSLTEGLPMILLEAMSANIPVIATRVGDIPATLNDLGLLIEPGDTPALASAIVGLTNALGTYRGKATAAARRVQDYYSAATMAARYEAVYRAVSPLPGPG
jgi:glycosyltransferase involved in cell wall biosynthesis